MPKHLYEDEALAQEVFEEEKDALYARQVEQELRDEDLARQLARAEERALAVSEALYRWSPCSVAPGVKGDQGAGRTGIPVPISMAISLATTSCLISM